LAVSEKAKASKPEERMAMERPAEFPKAIPFNANEVSASRDWIRSADRASRLNPNCNLGLFYVRTGTRSPEEAVRLSAERI